MIDASPAPTPSIEPRCASSRRPPTTACSRARCSSRPSDEELARFEPEALILHAPGFDADPARDGTRTGTFVVLHPTRQEVLIGGTFYAGEIKKSVFTLMNDRLPLEGVLPMHCSANVGADGDVAIFFGLSGTGKTTLSADPQRELIGDDEHGWGDDGVFNFEGGCYAKVIALSAEAEPEIYATTRTFGTLLENVVVDERGVLDLDNDAKTENTRAAYPLERIPNALPTKRAGHPTNVVFLTADAFGMLPPIARLSSAQARYHFLSGFTAKLAGHRDRRHRAGADLLACFGAPFLPQPPTVYAGCSARSSSATAGRLAREHRLDRRPGRRRRPPDADPGDPRAVARSAVRPARRSRDRTDPVFGFEVPRARPGARARRCSIPARPGPTRPPTTRRRRSSPASSGRTSSSSPAVEPEVAAAGPRL